MIWSKLSKPIALKDRYEGMTATEYWAMGHMFCTQDGLMISAECAGFPIGFCVHDPKIPWKF